MNVCGTQTYLSTRIKLMAAHLFTRQDIKRFIAMPLQELIAEFSLHSALPEELEQPQGNQVVERALLHLLMLEFSVLLRPLTHQARVLLLYWSRKFELYNLKSLIRGKLNQLDSETIRSDLHEMPDNIRLPHEALLHAENVLEMLRLLERGPYAAIARQARQVYEAQNEPFSLDAAIDRLYYNGLARYVETTEVTDKPGLHYLTSLQIDRQNILWLLRYRYVYRFAPSKAYYLLIPSGGTIDRNQLLRLSKLESVEALIEALPLRLSQLLTGIANNMQARQRLDQYLADEAEKLMRTTRCSVVAALSYLIKREKDLRDLFAIIQGKLLELDETTIGEAVVGLRPATPVDSAA